MAAEHHYLLSPLDQLMPPTYSRVFLAFTCRTASHSAVVGALRKGFKATCSQMPYLNGRVQSTEQQGGRLAISWSEHDPPPEFRLVGYPSDCRIPEYTQLKRNGLHLNHLPQSLCPVAGWVATSFPDGNAPVLAARYTPLVDGILVCLCVHHNVVDGTGLGKIIESWGKNTKGLLPEPLPEAEEPQHRLERLKACESPGVSNLPPSVDNKGYTFESLLALHPEYSHAALSSAPRVSLCTSRIFPFPVEKLKTAAIRHNTSVNNVLCAIIWCCISTVRSIRWEKEVGAATEKLVHTVSKLGMAVNGRARLGESFESAGARPYLGNVNLYSMTTLDMDCLFQFGNTAPPEVPTPLIETLKPVVDAISASINRIDYQFISEVISLADLAPNIQALRPGWDFLNGPDLTITSWANLDTYSVDFGPQLGSPDFVRVPYAEVDGLNIVLPRRRASKAEIIEVVVMLRQDDIAGLQRNAMWKYWTDVPHFTGATQKGTSAIPRT